MLAKRYAIGKFIFLAPALFLALVPLLRVAHHHADGGATCVAAHPGAHRDCERHMASVAPAFGASANNGKTPDPNHSANTCATCQSLMQLSSGGMCGTTPLLPASFRPEPRAPLPERTTIAPRQDGAIHPRAPPILIQERV